MRWATVLSLSFVTSIALAQNQNSTPKAFICKYVQSVTYNDDGSPKISHDKKDAMELIFANLDFGRNKSQVIGNQGAGDIFFSEGERVYNFIEETESGNIMLTSIFKNHKINKFKDENAFFSVHSRHTAIFNSGVPSQLTGVCFARN